MTNTHDKKLMDGKYSRRRIARSIYNGIMAYARTKGWTE
jgi:N-acetylmuramoyl-L-alanine amidase